MNATSDCNITINITTVNGSTCGSPLQELAVDFWAEFRIFAFGSAIYMVIVTLITLVANTLLLVVFLVDPLKLSKSPTSYFLIGLAISDLLNSMILLPINSSCFVMLYLQSPRKGLNLCRDHLLKVCLTQGTMTLTASFLIVFVFTVSQFVVVSSPLKFAPMVTSKKSILCVLLVYLYAKLIWLSEFWGISIDLLWKIHVFLHALFVPYLTIIFYILLHFSLKRKMAASRTLSNEISFQSRESNQNRTQRQFVTRNFILLSILIICSHPVVVFWLAVEFWLGRPLSPRMLTVNLMTDNILYLKIMLDPFVYAWRLPKYREALKKIFPVFIKCERKPKYERRLESSVFSQTCETVITLEIRKVESG